MVTISQFILNRSLDWDGFSNLDQEDLAKETFTSSDGIQFQLARESAAMIALAVRDMVVDGKEYEKLRYALPLFGYHGSRGYPVPLKTYEGTFQFEEITGSNYDAILKGWHRWYLGKYDVSPRAKFWTLGFASPRTPLKSKDGVLTSTTLPADMPVQGIRFPEGTKLTFKDGLLETAQLGGDARIFNIAYSRSTTLRFVHVQGQVRVASTEDPFSNAVILNAAENDDGLYRRGAGGVILFDKEGPLARTVRYFVSSMEFVYPTGGNVCHGSWHVYGGSLGLRSHGADFVDRGCIDRKLYFETERPPFSNTHEAETREAHDAISAAILTGANYLYVAAAQKIKGMRQGEVWHQKSDIERAIRILTDSMRDRGISEPRAVDILEKKASAIEIGTLKCDRGTEDDCHPVGFMDAQAKIDSLSAVAAAGRDISIFRRAIAIARNMVGRPHGHIMEEKLVVDLCRAGFKDEALRYVDSLEGRAIHQATLLVGMAKETKDLDLFKRAIDGYVAGNMSLKGVDSRTRKLYLKSALDDVLIAMEAIGLKREGELYILRRHPLAR